MYIYIYIYTFKICIPILHICMQSTSMYAICSYMGQIPEIFWFLSRWMVHFQQRKLWTTTEWTSSSHSRRKCNSGIFWEQFCLWAAWWTTMEVTQVTLSHFLSNWDWFTETADALKCVSNMVDIPWNSQKLQHVCLAFKINYTPNVERSKVKLHNHYLLH